MKPRELEPKKKKVSCLAESGCDSIKDKNLELLLVIMEPDSSTMHFSSQPWIYLPENTVAC